MTVLCLVEHDEDGPLDASLRAVTFGRSLLAGTEEALEALVVGQPSEDSVAALGAHGVRRVLAVDPASVGGYAPRAWARALADRVLADQAPGAGGGGVRAVVAASTDRGAEVMAHLGALTGLPMAANCFGAATAGAGSSPWRVTRQRWGGSLIEDATLDAATALLTVATDAVAPVPVAEPSLPRVELLVPRLEEGDDSVHAVESEVTSSGVSLASARVVVSGGRGVGGPEGFGVLEELAALLGGAVGVSRVVTSLGWRPHSMQVGQTGTKVTPDLYLACGISGAIQHLAGCQSAKTMVAVNADPDAPIMTRADYAVIGDLNEVLPALVAAIRARRG